MLWHAFEAYDPYGEANHPHPYRPLLPTDGSDPVAPLRERSDPAELARRALLDGAFRAALFRDPRNVGLLKPLMRFLWNGLAEQPRPELAAELRQAYTAGVRWVDGLLERALTFLEQAGLLENTLLIVAGSHGESFGEHGQLLHGRQLYDEPFCRAVERARDRVWGAVAGARFLLQQGYAADAAYVKEERPASTCPGSAPR